MNPNAPAASFQDMVTARQAGVFGRIPIAQAVGTLAAGLAAFTGAAAGLFAPPGIAALQIGAGVINPNSTLFFEAWIKRTGANGTANYDLRLGTANGAGDSAIVTLASAATTLLLSHVRGQAKFGALTTQFFTPQLLQPDVAGVATGADQSTNINTLLQMFLNIGVSSANAADSFSLIAYNAWIEQ